MKEIKIIISKIMLLIIDVSLFGYKLIKQIILPNRRKKGNLLTSLFVFFDGTLERLDRFEHGTFRMATILRQKYIKRCLILIAGFLFLLSSLECDGNKSFWNNSFNYIEHFSYTVAKEITVSKDETRFFHAETIQLASEWSFKNINHRYFSPSSNSVKLYLAIRNIRI